MEKQAINPLRILGRVAARVGKPLKWISQARLTKRLMKPLTSLADEAAEIARLADDLIAVSGKQKAGKPIKQSLRHALHYAKEAERAVGLGKLDDALAYAERAEWFKAQAANQVSKLHRKVLGKGGVVPPSLKERLSKVTGVTGGPSKAKIVGYGLGGTAAAGAAGYGASKLTAGQRIAETSGRIAGGAARAGTAIVTSWPAALGTSLAVGGLLGVPLGYLFSKAYSPSKADIRRLKQRVRERYAEELAMAEAQRAALRRIDAIWRQMYR